ncbi:MAG: hypothetical protein ORN54_07720 [Cyclobacteriaceae bacterium]|nr:hypothetical protein [Cyclobacteriaceae bacterium]
MKALILNSIIFFGMIMLIESCEKEDMTPCAKGVLVETVGNCYLIIEVLNAPIGKSFTYKRPYPSNDPETTYTNAIKTTLTINANYLDTIYFKYDKNIQFNCPFGPGAGLVDVPNVPAIKILNYSLKSCPQ